MSAWDRLETENDLFVLTGLLLEWLEHLRAPALGKDAITYIVIHCDNVETAISKVYFMHVFYAVLDRNACISYYLKLN